MNLSQPPRFATWLLTRLISGDKRETLIGDLVEHYQHGRSSAWYWRQTFIAISVGAVRDIRGHKLRAARAVFIGLAIVWLFAMTVEPDVVAWASAWQVSFNNWLLESGHDSLRWRWSQLHAYNLTSTMVWCAFYGATGWVVARLGRPSGMSTVFLYIVCLVIWDVPLIYSLVVAARATASGDALRGLFFWLAFATLGMPLSILLGGLWGARPDGHAPREMAIQ